MKASLLQDFQMPACRTLPDGQRLGDQRHADSQTQPGESKYPWDYYKLVATIPPDQAFRPLSESECPQVKK
jgi:branched-chain amino acid transport system substrate-binding protein